MNRLFMLTLVISGGMLACAAPSENQLKDKILGTWKSISFEVQKNSINNTDSSSFSKVTPENYTEATGLSTAIVTYYPDHTYIENYLDPDGKSVYSQSGYYIIKEDSIILAIHKPLTSQSIQRYRARIEGDSGHFTGMLDYDRDGAEDDYFYGVSVKVE